MATPASSFNGFDTGDAANKRLTGVPASFFTRLLPQITNINELKVLLQIIYLAGQKRSDPKWVGYWELEESADFMSGLRRPGDPRPAAEHLREGLELAIARGSIIRLVASPAPEEFGHSRELEPVPMTWFLLNTENNRDFVTDLADGKIKLEDTSLAMAFEEWEWALPGDAPAEDGRQAVEQWKNVKMASNRPDIYTLYEQNIGVLTPLMSDRLREAVKLYPPEWIAEAFEQAVTYNRRNWAYISKILEKWLTEGRAKEQPGERQYERERRNGPAGRGRVGRSGLAGDGTGTPGTQPPVSGQGMGAEGRAAPDRGRGLGSRDATYYAKRPGDQPLDFAKYTTGKYAYLTRTRKPDPKGPDKP